MDPTETPTGAPEPSGLPASAREHMSLGGAVQPYGCLVACAVPSWVVGAVSANAGAFFGRDAGSVLGETLDTLLPGKTLHDLRNVLQASMMSGGAERLLDQAIDDGPERYDLTVHMAASNAVVEIVPRCGADPLATDPVTLVKSMVARLKRAPTLERSLALAANQVRAVTGFDRVVVYRFLPDGTGEVAAESLRSGLQSSLGRRYPACDVPEEARALHRRQWLQMIADVDREPVPLLVGPGPAAAADLGLATLRGVSPAERDRLRGLGSRATLTISLMAGDALWGLIACHHSAPRRVSAATCTAAELFGQIFSLQVEAREQAKDLVRAAELRRANDRLVAALAPGASLLALVLSLMRRGRPEADTIEGFAGDLERRIRALAAQERLTRGSRAAAPLRRLIEAEAHASKTSPDRVVLSGPDVTLDARASRAMASVVHEMMADAVRHGALGRQGGRLAVDWSRDAGGDLRIAWRECGGPPVTPPERHRLGGVIVERTVPFELGGEARIEFLAEGVQAIFLIPALHVGDGARDDAEGGATPAPSLPRDAKRLLLVEDGLMVALDAQATLTGEGFDVAVAGTAADAERLLDVQAFDAAVLDVTLAGETGFQVADRLVGMGSVFVFASGCRESAVVPERFRGVPVVSKPYDGEALRMALPLRTGA